MPTVSVYDDLSLPHAIVVSVSSGDIEQFRALVFASGSPKVLTNEAAEVLRSGFRYGQIGSVQMYQSFVSLCVGQRRPEFLREVIEAAGNDRPTSEGASLRQATFEALCCAAADSEPCCRTPAREIADRLSAPASEFPEFIILNLEYAPHDDALQRLRDANAEARAVITECEMQLRVRQRVPAASVHAAETTPVRARRRSL